MVTKVKTEKNYIKKSLIIDPCFSGKFQLAPESTKSFKPIESFTTTRPTEQHENANMFLRMSTKATDHRQQIDCVWAIQDANWVCRWKINYDDVYYYIRSAIDSLFTRRWQKNWKGPFLFQPYFILLRKTTRKNNYLIHCFNELKKRWQTIIELLLHLISAITTVKFFCTGLVRWKL